MIIAIVALIVKARGFALLDKLDATNTGLNRRIDEPRADTNWHLATIETDLKEFFKVQAEHYKRIQRLEETSKAFALLKPIILNLNRPCPPRFQ